MKHCISRRIAWMKKKLKGATIEVMKYDKFLDSFRQFIADCPEETLSATTPYVFLSDLHMGNGTSRDDLGTNRQLVETMLESWYLAQDYMLILNGDVEDLNKFPLGAIRNAWPELLAIIAKFAERGKLRKIIGNHDYELLLEKNYPWPIYPGMVYRVGDNRIFVFHGHQASTFYVKFDYVSEFLVRYFVRPLHIHNSGVSQDSRRRFRTEKRIYRAARALGVVAVTGHTHRPLFESLSKYDNIRITLEDLLRDYIDAGQEEKLALEGQIRMYRDEMKKLSAAKEREKKTQSLYGTDPFFIPCVFNSGCATGKHGITALEIRDGKISLVYWANGKDSRPYIATEALDSEIVEGDFLRYTLHRERLDGIFTRITLLGGEDA
jgi:predicted phosphodiesterase